MIIAVIAIIVFIGAIIIATTTSSTSTLYSVQVCALKAGASSSTPSYITQYNAVRAERLSFVHTWVNGF